MSTRVGALCLVLSAVAACASGGPPAADTCKVRVAGVEKWVVDGRGVEAAYRVEGVAGSPAEVSLVAVNPSGSMVAGYGVDVGPGAFAAVVEQKLTGVPKSFVVLLEFKDLTKRCKTDAKKPS